MENLLQYPATAVVNRPLPKNAFYRHWDLGTKQRQHFVDDISSLTWLYKLGGGTVNVVPGRQVVEIDFFAATLKEQDCPDDVFSIIDTFMPRHIVFIQCYKEEYRLLLNYKDGTNGDKRPFHIVKTFKTKWLPADKLRLPIKGKTLDDVWENFAGTISGYGTTTAEETHTIISLEERIHVKVKAAEALQKKIRKERQFSRQVEMNIEARQLKREIASLQDEVDRLKHKDY